MKRKVIESLPPVLGLLVTLLLVVPASAAEPNTGTVVAQQASPATAPPSKPQEVDPNALLGRWRGQVGAEPYGGYPVWLDVVKIDGEHVEAVFYMRAAKTDPYTLPYYNRDVRVSGTLTGNVLELKIAGIASATLVVDGKTMDGVFHGAKRQGSMTFSKQ